MRHAKLLLPALVAATTHLTASAGAQTTTTGAATAPATNTVSTTATTAATAADPATTATLPAAAAKPKKKAKGTCVTLGFEVNDYGKEGPTRDAKALLDAYVVKWAAANSIKKYKMGEKTVDCKLFLDFGVFDEHTCTASADVCWQGAPKKEALVTPD
jgi:hypothetical protein